MNGIQYIAEEGISEYDNRLLTKRCVIIEKLSITFVWFWVTCSKSFSIK